MTFTASDVYRDFVTDGVPSSGANKPKKSEIRALLSQYEQIIGAFTSNGGLIFFSKATLDASLNHGPNTMAWVLGDPVAANNGIYIKNGASGFGSWTRLADLPYSFIVASDTGAGAPNAIQASSALPVTTSALVLLSVFEANTASPVTVSFNGGSPLTIKTNGGNDLAPGGIVSGMVLLGRVSGSSFRLVSDQASAALLAQMEELRADAVEDLGHLVDEAAGYRDQAADYANFARNNWVLNGPFAGSGQEKNYPLSVDPGSANNMFVVVGGVSQLLTENAYSLVYDGANPFIRINVPFGVNFEVRISNAIDVLSPSDGSVGTTKISNNAVTFAKMQDIDSARLIGRKTVGTGDPEALTTDDLLDFLPAGAVIGRAAATPYVANVDLTTAIPGDDTIPQITEGTQILTVAYTPKRASSLLRLTFRGQATRGDLGGVAAAIFQVGAANAIGVRNATAGGANYAVPLDAEKVTPAASLTQRTYSVRVGPIGSGTMRMNGVLASRLWGGIAECTLEVEEIKA